MLFYDSRILPSLSVDGLGLDLTKKKKKKSAKVVFDDDAMVR